VNALQQLKPASDDRIDRHWVPSFFGVKPPRIERYVDRVRGRAAEVRNGATERGVETVR
jgi:hypothetical protein